MKKLLLLYIFFGLIFSSCKKDNYETNKQNLLFDTETPNVSKIKLLSNGTTLLTTFNDKTGEISITPEKGEKITIYVTYKLYKKINDTYQPISSMNQTKYLNKFLIISFSTIPIDTIYKVDLNVQTSSGGNCTVTIEGKKK